MTDEDIVLAAMHGMGDKITGRTCLQKTMYFVAKKLRLDLGFDPHFYGPYSRRVTMAADALVASSVLCESRQVFEGGPTDFERVRYDYEIRDLEYLAQVEANGSDELKEIERIAHMIGDTGADYRQLSYAAKLHHIVEESAEPMTASEIEEKALDLGWKMSRKDVAAAVKVLLALKLIKVV